MRTICGTILAALLPVAVCAATYKVDIDRSDGLYRCGETATFTVRVLSTNALADAANPCAMLDNFGSSVLTNMPFDVTTTGVAFTVTGTLSEPGFLRLSLPPTKSGRDDPSVFSVGFERRRSGREVRRRTTSTHSGRRHVRDSPMRFRLTRG